MAKNSTMWIVVIVVIGVLLYSSGALSGILGKGTTGSVENSATPAVQTQACQFNPALVVSAKDKFGTTAVSGTTYYKVDGNPATTSALNYVNKGENYEVWVDNQTGKYFVKPFSGTAGCGNNNWYLDAYLNTTPSLTSYDVIQRVALDSGTSGNASMGANDRASIEFTYQGVNKKSFMPFGGVMVIEYNSTMASVTCSGADITTSNDFHITYSPSSTSHTYSIWKVLPSLDEGLGAVKTINCEFQNGASPMVGDSYIVTLYPANYYLTNAGSFSLDVQKFLNDATTKTAYGQVSTTDYWAA